MSSPVADYFAEFYTIIATWTGAILAVSFYLLPIFVLGLIAKRRKARYKAAADEPFTDQPLRPPGESLRISIERIREEFDESVSTLLFTGMTAGLVTALLPREQMMQTGAGVAVVVAIFYVWSARKLFSLQRKLWNYQLGFAGERVVGEALNQLCVSGFHVFHDLPFDGFNIDHVIVGPSGVYAVETKTRRKPSDLKGTEKARVTFDGHCLEYPKKITERNSLTQVLRNAETLSDWLTKATGEPTPVSPILVLPGWYVLRQKSGLVKVLNEKEIAYSFPIPRAPLSVDRVERIIYQLAERCKISKTDTKP